MDDTTKIRKVIERALADGKISKDENDDIKAAMYADHKVTEEECALYRKLQEKIWLGEVQIDY
jgi:hypothetical protein